MQMLEEEILERRKGNEKVFRQQVLDLARLLGYKAYFSWTSIHSPRGFPDLVLASPERRRLVFAELKSEKGRVMPAQQEWLQCLRDCGQEVYVWRPSDFEEIVKCLKGDNVKGGEK